MSWLPLLVAKADEFGFPNFLLNLAAIAIPLLLAALVARPLLRAKRKDGTISDQENAIKAKDAYIETLEGERDRCLEQNRQMEEAVKFAQKQEAVAEAKYEEQARYTAESALNTIEGILERSETESERRHREIISALAKIVPATGVQGASGPAGPAGAPGPSGPAGRDS